MVNGSNPQLEYAHSYSTDTSTVRFDMMNARSETTFADFTPLRPKESPNINELSTSAYRQQMPNMNLQNNLNAGMLSLVAFKRFFL